FVERLQHLADLGINTGLFAFTPLAGTPLADQKPPSLVSYRRMQAARHLIFVCGLSDARFTFDAEGQLTGFGISPAELHDLLADGTAFRTSGCPDCNRPYYNERPGGVMYNYPRPLAGVEIRDALENLENGLVYP
ncbi:MAG: radical SAM protein, partial [Anaerolineae bacterium]